MTSQQSKVMIQSPCRGTRSLLERKSLLVSAYKIKSVKIFGVLIVSSRPFKLHVLSVPWLMVYLKSC